MSDITRDEDKFEQQTSFIVTDKLTSVSNWLYNKGLEKAQIRDLSGAINFLTLSIKYSKMNINARNLLGLVYFEVGEIVSALEQWVISRHIQPEDNAAQKYINDIQANQTKLDNLNQAIVKYNGALAQIKQKSSDLAIIQLKKVITMNTNFVKAYCLLALVYIKEGDYEKARRQLNKVLEIDRTNPLANRYLNEISSNQPSTNTGNKRFLKEVNNISEKPNKKSSKSNLKSSAISQVIFIILGLISGAAAVFALVVPGITIYQKQQTKQWKTKYEQLQATTEANSGNQNNSKEDELNSQIHQLQEDLELAKGDSDKLEQLDKLFVAMEHYLNKDMQQAAEQILSITSESIENTSAEPLYQRIRQESFAEVIRVNYNTGKRDYDNRRYEEGLASLKIAEIYLEGATVVTVDSNGSTVETVDSNYANVIYFIARCNHALGENAVATQYYEIIINNFKNYRNYQRAVNYNNMINN